MDKTEKEVLELEWSIHKLNQEIDEIGEILMKYDKELNKQYKLIKAIKEYCKKTHMTIEEYEELVEMTEKEEK